VRPAAAVRARDGWDVLRVFLFLLSIVTVSRVHQSVPALAALRPALLLALLSLFYAMLHPTLLGDGTWVKTQPARMVIGLVMMAVISAPLGISLGATFYHLVNDASKTFLFCFLIMAMMRSGGDLKRMVWAYVVSCAILGWMAIFTFNTYMSYSAGHLMERLGHLYTYDANDLGVVILTGLPLTLLAYQFSGKLGKVAALVIVSMLGVALARTGSRGAFVALVITAIVLLFWAEGVSVPKRIAFVSVAGLSLAIGAGKGYWAMMSTVAAPEDDYNMTSEVGRKAVALRGLSYMLHYPIAGVGADNFGRAEGTISEKARNFTEGAEGVRWQAPHNTFVQAGAELGVPGLCFYTALVVGGMFGLRRLRRRMPKSWATSDDPELRVLWAATIYLPCAFVAYVASSFFVSFLWLDTPYFLAALSCGAHVVARRRMRDLGISAGVAPADRRAVNGRRSRQGGGVLVPGRAAPLGVVPRGA
jgi:hypothetical protein